jgi:hypothetical protein
MLFHAADTTGLLARRHAVLTLRNPQAVSSIADPGIRRLVEQRFVQICAGEAYDVDLHGYMIVVEPGDSVAALEDESGGCPILHNLFDDARYGQPDFAPSFDPIRTPHQDPSATRWAQ